MIHAPSRSVRDGSGSHEGPEPPGAPPPPNGAPSPAASVPNGHVPEPARELEFLGVYANSGHRKPPALVRRADGQIVQLTPVLYRVLQEIDGRRGYDDIAAAAGPKIGKSLTPQDVRFLTDKKLRPLGLLRTSDGSAPTMKRANPLLALGLRKIITNPKTTNRITAPFTKLFLPPVVFAVVIGFLLTTGWLLFSKGLAAPTRHALYEPGLLLLVFALTTLSAGFHELGHAAACRYGGATPGAMGAGFYLVWPAFYTDVSDAYRLDRRARLRVDLGGLYFNALFSVVAFFLWLAVGWDALLIVIPLQLLQMLRQLIPLVRLDGYHILADLTGVPDLFAHIKPILLGLLPTRWGRPENKLLRPRVRFIVTTWVALVLPILLFTFAIIVVMFPRLAATAWDSLGLQWQTLQAEWAHSDPIAIAARMLSIVALAIPVLGIGYLLTRVIRRTSRRLWRGTKGRPVMRSIAMLAVSGLIALVGTAWWPDGQYQPIGKNASGLPVDVRFRELPVIDRLLAAEQSGSAGTAASLAERSPVEPAEPLPPQPETAGDDASSAIGIDPSPSPSPGFTFAAPSKPEEGDNQALAMNYEDDSSIVDLAYSLLFVTDEVTDNSNEAWALASCNDCVAVAVAFQVLLILDQVDVIVPENVAVAANAYCNNCVTQALAMQLIITLSEPLDDEAMAELDRIAKKLEELERSMIDMPMDQIYAQLQEIQTEILNLLVAEGAVDGHSSETSGETSGEKIVEDALPSPKPSAKPDATPSPEPTSEPSPGPSPEPSSEPSPDPSPEPSGEPSPSPSPTPNDGSSP